ncbi:hypothetical protein [Mycolicibacterium vaccae]|uniref:hypothetical protein n=1 Tax=Mycolicibacterium vaccae TaxID=1810 RepID=UPI003D05A505
MELLGILFLWALMGGVGMVIANAKNRSLIEGFILGGLCGCFGVIVEACLPKQMPKAPHGMRAVSCPRCNAVQNIEMRAPSYECWQCHTRVSTGVQPTPIEPIKPRGKTDPERTRRISCPSCRTSLMVKPTTTKYRCFKCDSVHETTPL